MPPKKRLLQLRQVAERELKEVKVLSATVQLALDASTAQVMDQSETVEGDEGQIDAYYLTQVVRNTSGEYFLLKTTGKKPYVKHLRQERAKIVLKSKYRAPGTQ